MNHIDTTINIQDNTKDSVTFWILEPLLRAPHGQTIGYQKIKGKFAQFLEKTESSKSLIGVL